MANTTLELKLHHTKDELYSLYKKSKNPTEKIRIQFIWIIKNTDNNNSTLSISAEEGAHKVGMKRTWARDTIHKYNKKGLEGLSDLRTMNKRPQILQISQEQSLKEVLKSNSPDGGLWNGPKVAIYLGEILGKKVSAVTGWKYLNNLGFSLKAPRLAHSSRATEDEQKEFKKNSQNTTRKSKKKIQRN